MGRADEVVVASLLDDKGEMWEGASDVAVSLLDDMHVWGRDR